MMHTLSFKTDFIKNGNLHILRKQKVINLNEIVMMKADINYSIIHLENGEKIIVTKTLKILENILNNEFFYRIHRNTLINKKHIISYNSILGEVSLTNNQVAYISRRKKETFDILMKK
jgi:two-component system, LytTR family, response regulator